MSEHTIKNNKTLRSLLHRVNSVLMSTVKVAFKTKPHVKLYFYLKYLAIILKKQNN